MNIYVCLLVHIENNILWFDNNFRVWEYIRYILSIIHI